MSKVILNRVDIVCMKEKDNQSKEAEMYANTAYNIYTENNVGVESSEKLVEMLYEGVLRFNAQARKAIKEGDRSKKVYWINRSTAVIVELISILDKSNGDIGYYLEGLYSYQLKLLADANIEDSVEKINEVSGVFKGLLEAWREVTDVAN
jgi:flagellar protein FliS